MHKSRTGVEIVLSIAIASMFVFTVGNVSAESSAGPGIICDCVCAHNCGGGSTYDLIAVYPSDGQSGVCVSGSCSNCNSPVKYGGDLYLQQGVQVTITACDFATGDIFEQWLSNAGSLGSSTSPTTTFVPRSNNSLWLVAGTIGRNNYIGYQVQYDGMDATLARADITTPTSVNWLQCASLGGDCPKVTIPGYGSIYNAEQEALWVGLYGNGQIWQAGLMVIAGTTWPAPVYGSVVTLVSAWYEACTGSGSSVTWLWNQIYIGFGQTVTVEVMQASPTSAYYYFYNHANDDILQNYVSFSAPTESAIWVMESPQLLTTD
jgi:hypothetical protein